MGYLTQGACVHRGQIMLEISVTVNGGQFRNTAKGDLEDRSG